MEKGDITIKNQIYTLKVTANKRQLIYFNNKLVNTKPFNINENKDILTPPPYLKGREDIFINIRI